MLFENKNFEVRYIEYVNKEDYLHNFYINIKNFDTPPVSIKYDIKKEKIVSMCIEEEDNDNIPKNQVSFKLLDLARYELCSIFKFMIDHV